MRESTTVADLVELLSLLEVKERHTREALSEIETQKAAVQTTLTLYKSHHCQGVPTHNLPDIRGLTQMAALDAIADANGGEIRVIEARDHMLASGFFTGSKKPRKNAMPQIRSLLDRSGRYELSSPGVYRQITPAVSAEGVEQAA